MNHIFGGICALLSILFLVILFRDLGYKSGADDGLEAGYLRGYEEGFRDAQAFSDHWWVNAEGEVAEARQKIWREEIPEKEQP